MKGKYLFITLALGLGLTLALLWLLSSPSASVTAAPVHQPQQATAGVITVCVSGSCDYSTIQAAVDAAVPGDVIKVATGVYTGVQGRPAPPGYPYPWPAPTEVVTQVVYISKTVTIRGGYTAPGFSEPPNPIANPTTVDAQHQGRVIFIMGNTSPTIEGLRVTGGGLDGHICRIEPGGGVYVGSTAATIQDNRIFGNRGGGLFVRDSAAMVSGNIVTDNEACDGAGLTLEGSNATISDNLFSTNDATSAGGGIWLVRSDATLINNVVIDNTASWGGGMRLLESDATLINNAVVDNQVSEGGSGLWVVGCSSRLLQNTIARNTGADGSGVRVEAWEGIPSSVALTNTILISHSVGISVTGGSTVTVNGVLWHNTAITVSKSVTAVVTVNNQFTGNPLFAADGYHLTAGSAAIDEGVDAGITVDIDGELRPAGGGFDLGADEFWYRVYLPLVLRNQ